MSSSRARGGSLFALISLLSASGCAKDVSPPSVPNQSPPPSPPGIFRDVAAEMGLNHRWGHGGKTPLTIIETIGHGCAFLDYDQDGWMDVLLVGNRRCALYRNEAGKRFTDVTEGAGLTAEGEFWGVAVGDYDNDGYPDIYVTGYGKCVLYRNDGGRKTGDGRPGKVFTDVTRIAGVGARGPHDVAVAAAFADFDGDGDLDLFAGRYIVFTPESQQFCTYSGVQAGCGVKNYDAAMPVVYRNNGDGNFTDATRSWGFEKSHGKCLGVAVRAAERGVALYAANDELQGDLFAPAGKRFDEIGTPSGAGFNRDGLTQGGMGVDWGDYNNDGRQDLVVATFQGEASSLYRAESETLYSEVGGELGIAVGTTPFVGWTARFFDYDNDGWLDLLFTNGHTQDNVHLTERDVTYPQKMLLFRNEEGKAFRDAAADGGPAFAQPFVGRGAATGDFDNDGKLDLLVVDEEGPVKLLRNESPPGGHWLGVRLIGKTSNRDGIGARVTVTAGGRTYVREQQLAGGYISARDPRVHFGLGTATKVDKVVVRWPNGKVDSLRNVPVDRYFEVVEGSGS